MTLVWNKGVSYGLFPQQSYAGQLIIIFFSLIICVWIAKFITNSDIRYRRITLKLISMMGDSKHFKMTESKIYALSGNVMHVFEYDKNLSKESEKKE